MASPPPSPSRVRCAVLTRKSFCDPAVVSERNDRGVRVGRPLEPRRSEGLRVQRGDLRWRDRATGVARPVCFLLCPSVLPAFVPLKAPGRPLPWGVESVAAPPPTSDFSSKRQPLAGREGFLLPGGCWSRLESCSYKAGLTLPPGPCPCPRPRPGPYWLLR